MFNNKYKRYLKNNIYFISNSTTQFNYFKSLDIDNEFKIIFIDKLGDLLDFLELDESITAAEDKTYIFSFLDLPSDIKGVINELVDYYDDLPSLVIEFFDDSYIDTHLKGNFNKSVKVLSIMDFEQDISEESFRKLNDDRNKVFDNKNSHDDYFSLDFDDVNKSENGIDRLSVLNKNKVTDVSKINEEELIKSPSDLAIEDKDFSSLFEDNSEFQFDFENNLNDESEESEEIDIDDFEIDESLFYDDDDSEDLNAEDDSEDEFNLDFDKEFNLNFDDLDENENENENDNDNDDGLNFDDFNFDEDFKFDNESNNESNNDFKPEMLEKAVLENNSFDNNKLKIDLDKKSIDILKLEELNKSLIKEYESGKFQYEKEIKSYVELLKNLKSEILNLKNENNSLLSNIKEFESELRTKVSFDLLNENSSKDIILELNTKENLILNIEKELKTLKHKNSSLETQILGTKSLNKEQFLEIKRLNIEIENLNNKVIEIRSLHSEVLKDYILLSDYEKVVSEKEFSDLKIFDLEGQISILKTDISKNEEQKELLKEEFSNIESLYKAILTSDVEVKNNDFNELNLGDDVMTNVLYFKMISRPSYFGSFLRSLKDLVSKTGRVLVLIIQEENYQTPLYYPNVPILNEFDSIKNYDNEDTIILKPSKYMLGSDSDLFSVFDTVIVLDYSNTKKILIKGNNVLSIYTCINQKECDLLGLKGTILCNIGDSVVDLKYDNKFEFAITSFVRKTAVDKKVKVWLNNIGIKVK